MRPALALALVLAACAPSVPVAPPSTAEQACKQRIDDDPAVKEEIAKSADPNWLWQNAGKIEIVKQQAMARCMQRRGVHVGGGVERPR